jgi:hypothetical protein
MINAAALANSSCLTMMIKLSEVIVRHKRERKLCCDKNSFLQNDVIEIGNNGQYNLSHFVNNLLLMATLEHQVFEQIQQRLDEETARKDVGII